MIGVAPFRQLVLGAVSSGVYVYVTSGTSTPVNCQDHSKLAVYLQSDGGVISAGVLTIEEADYDPQSGPAAPPTAWSAITTLDATTITAGIAQMVYHFPPDNAYAFVRVRLSSAVTGGGKVIAVLRGRE